MFWQRKIGYLTEFTGEIGHYRQIILISYFPPSQHFGARKDVNSRRGLAQEPIVLIELVLATSLKLYRWNRLGMVEAIDRATATQDWSHIFQLAQTDIGREVDRELLCWRI
jgi:hypothetical protein